MASAQTPSPGSTAGGPVGLKDTGGTRQCPRGEHIQHARAHVPRMCACVCPRVHTHACIHTHTCAVHMHPHPYTRAPASIHTCVCTYTLLSDWGPPLGPTNTLVCGPRRCQVLRRQTPRKCVIPNLLLRPTAYAPSVRRPLGSSGPSQFLWRSRYVRSFNTPSWSLQMYTPRGLPP